MWCVFQGVCVGGCASVRESLLSTAAANCCLSGSLFCHTLVLRSYMADECCVPGFLGRATDAAASGSPIEAD